MLIAFLPVDGKGRAVPAVLLPTMVCAVLWRQDPTLWADLGQGLVALLVFLVLPATTLGRWEKRLTAAVAETVTDNPKNLLWAETASRLRGLGTFFRELGRTFKPGPAEEADTGEEEVFAVFQEIADQNCQSCSRYDYCWKERFYQTYRELFTLLGWIEMGVKVNLTHLKGHLAEECLKKESLLTTVNLVMEQERTGHYWRRRYAEAQIFLAERLTGVAGILNQMAETAAINLDCVPESEQKLSRTLRKAGVAGARISIVPGGNYGRTRLLVEKRSCGGAQECRLVVAPLLAKTLGWRLAVTSGECGRAGEGRCLFCLAPEPEYDVRPTVAQVPKKGNQVSGDSQRMRLIREDLFLALLSDGMGVGTAAARISRAAIKLMEEMLVAGFEKSFALQSLNSLLLLATPEEEFTTLDLLLFDRITGEVELFKVGSAPTYVKKGREVQVIRSASLPMGIVPRVDPEYYRDFLDDGDLVVMVSDGAALLSPAKEDWILKALKRSKETAAEPLSRYLLELAWIEANGEINDDLSIIVLQIVGGRRRRAPADGGLPRVPVRSGLRRVSAPAGLSRVPALRVVAGSGARGPLGSGGPGVK
ncbi:MAG: SpoIIE family protein phosphatase [Firmicutes bacterium]|nr:SpoIIE family protein phosphatase [Bacillota bacterium]